MQRITLGLVILLCLCSVVASAFVWQAVQQGQQVTAALVAEVKAMREESNQPEDERFKYLDWVPVKFKLVDEAGQPIADPGCTVHLIGEKLFSDSLPNRVINEHPDATGVVDFGIIKPGMREFFFQTPWDGVMQMKNYNVRPGYPVDLEITCPREVFHMVDTKLTIEWPEDLQQENLWTYLGLNAIPREVDGQEWNTSVPTYKWFLIDPNGRIYETNLSYDWAENQNPTLNMSDTFHLGYLELFLTGKTSYENQAVPARFSTDYERYHEPDNVKKRYHQSLERQIIAELSKSSRTIALAESGMRIMSMHVLQGVSTEDDRDSAQFRNLLPIGLSNLGSEEYLLRGEDQPISDQWRYQPNETIVELVRKRLEQLEVEEKRVESELNESISKPNAKEGVYEFSRCRDVRTTQNFPGLDGNTRIRDFA